MQEIEIVYQENDFIVINKPDGISVHKDQEIEGLTKVLARQLNTSQVWLVHRLDKVTSGLLILALNEKAAAELSQLFARHLVQKIYLALSCYKPKKKQGRIIGDMQKSRRGAWKLCFSKQNPSITDFISINCAPNLRLFVLAPRTGKTHQLRVAMKSLGSPILGDKLYGDQTPADRVYLHAYGLQFHYQGRKIEVICAPTKGSLFHDIFVYPQMEEIASFIDKNLQILVRKT